MKKLWLLPLLLLGAAGCGNDDNPTPEPPEPEEQTIECCIIEPADGSTVDMSETDKLQIFVFADVNVGRVAAVDLRIDGVSVRDLRPAGVHPCTDIVPPYVNFLYEYPLSEERQPGDLLIEFWAEGNAENAPTATASATVHLVREE